MRKTFLLISILISIVNCKDKKNDTPKGNVKTELTKPTQEIKYVIAKSGLIYRDNPKGKKLGKFEFGEKIIITERTNIFQKIKDINKTIEGEWLRTKIGGKSVYVFDGFLSNTKPKITPELVKYFMGDYIWVSEEFKMVLNETKLISKAYENVLYSDIACTKDDSDNGILLLCADASMEELDILKLDFSSNDKTISINSKMFTIQKDGKKYQFTKSDITKPGEDYFFLPDGPSDNYAKQWIKRNFKGDYIFKDENKSKKYNSKELSYFIEYEDISYDIIKIENKYYSIDKIVGQVYHLLEIEYDDFIHPMDKKATLTKIKDK